MNMTSCYLILLRVQLYSANKMLETVPGAVAALQRESSGGAAVRNLMLPSLGKTVSGTS